jgi:hypothetical protein
MVEPLPITVFLARFRVGCNFGAMIHLRDNARIVGHPNIIHWFSTMSRPGETGNSLAFTALSGVLFLRARFPKSPYAVQ